MFSARSDTAMVVAFPCLSQSATVRAASLGGAAGPRRSRTFYILSRTAAAVGPSTLTRLRWPVTGSTYRACLASRPAATRSCPRRCGGEYSFGASGQYREHVGHCGGGNAGSLSVYMPQSIARGSRRRDFSNFGPCARPGQ